MLGKGLNEIFRMRIGGALSAMKSLIIKHFLISRCHAIRVESVVPALQINGTAFPQYMGILSYHKDARSSGHASDSADILATPSRIVAIRLSAFWTICSASLKSKSGEVRAVIRKWPSASSAAALRFGPSVCVNVS